MPSYAILATQYAPSAMPAMLAAAAIGTYIHSRLWQAGKPFILRTGVTSIAAAAILLATCCILFRFRIDTIEIVLIFAWSLFVPTLLAEKAIHYETIKKHFRTPLLLLGVAFLAFLAIVINATLSVDRSPSEFYAIHRTTQKCVVTLIVIVAWLVPARYVFPYTIGGLLYAMAQYGRGSGFWGWPGHGVMNEPYHTIATHFVPVLLVGLALEFLPSHRDPPP
tara:strand:- start:674 stop:1339 length:666 start_codon:yes stop_codon:yes gene_type:complete